MDFDFQEPTLELKKLIFNHKKKIGDSYKHLINYIKDNEMYDFYMRLTKKGVIDHDSNIAKELLACKENTLNNLVELKSKDPENASHITSVNISIANYLARVGDIEKAIEIMSALVRDDASLSFSMDVQLCKIRLAILTNDKKMLEAAMLEAADICEHGCDWDRRNKFKIHKAVYCMMSGGFKEAAILFSEALPSFCAYEILSYKDAVQYLIFCGLLTFDREEMKNRILECSDVLEVGTEKAIKLCKSLYDCAYYDFLPDLYFFTKSVENDVYLSRFLDYFCKEMKLIGYQQILRSYRSLSLQTMAEVFGIHSEFLEQDIANFVVEGRLSCKIDRVSGNVLKDDSVADKLGCLEQRGSNLLRMIKKNIE